MKPLSITSESILGKVYKFKDRMGETNWLTGRMPYSDNPGIMEFALTNFDGIVLKWEKGDV